MFGLQRFLLAAPTLCVFLNSPAISSTNNPDAKSEVDIFSLSLRELVKVKYTVTGSHIRRDNFEGSSPLTVISNEDLKTTGATTLIGALQKSIFIGNGTFSSQNNTPDSTAIGGASVSLRGLGADSTLILLNGRRIVTSPFANEIDTAFVDLNNIPLSTVERVEILKDGASAIYGSDAIAGVINIILRKDIEGTELNVKSGYTADGGGEENTINLLWGGLSGATSHTVMIDLFDREAIFRDDRDFSASADQRSRGGFDRRSSSGFTGAFRLDSATYIAQSGQAAFNALPAAAKRSYVDTYGNDVCPADSIVGTNCLYDFNPPSTLLPESQRINFTYLGNHEFSRNLSGLAEFSVMDSSTTVLGAPSLANNNAFIAGDNPNHPVANLPSHPLYQLPLQIRRRLIEAGDREKEVETDYYRAVLGLEGIIKQWNWQLTYINTESSATEKGVDGFVNALRLQSAIDTGLFNVFEPSASSPDAVSFMQTSTVRDGTSKSTGVSGKLSKNIYTLRKGADIAMALGLERREDSIKDEPDPQYLRGEINGTDFTQGKSDRDNTAFFAELEIPATDTLNIQLATRHEDYSDFGSTTNPKIGFRWSVIEALDIHASWGTAFRAPSLIQRGLGSSNESPVLVDTERCLVTGAPLDCNPREYNAIVQGNPELAPEESTNYNVGAVWKINPDTTMGIDYWNFDIDDLISRNPQFIVDTYGLDSNFVERSLSTILGVPGEINFVYDTYANIGGLETDGIDIYLNYSLSHRWGVFSFTPAISYVLNLEESQPSGTTNSNGDPIFETVDLNGEYNNPKLRGELPVSWKKGHWLSSIRLNYIDDYRDNVAGGADQRRVDDWLTMDVRVAYSGFEKITLAIGASNITNEEPPLAQTESVGFDNKVHSVQGRFVYGEVNYKF